MQVRQEVAVTTGLCSQDRRRGRDDAQGFERGFQGGLLRVLRRRLARRPVRMTPPDEFQLVSTLSGKAPELRQLLSALVRLCVKRRGGGGGQRRHLAGGRDIAHSLTQSAGFAPIRPVSVPEPQTHRR